MVVARGIPVRVRARQHHILGCTAEDFGLRWRSRQPPVSSTLGTLSLHLAIFARRPSHRSFLQRVGATDDFHQFGGNRRLARTVVVEGQAINHLRRTLRRSVHGGHLSAEE